METSPQLSTPTPTLEDPVVDENGFLVNTHTWTPRIAAIIATRCEISPLGETHWEVINFLRRRYLSLGAAPAMRTVCKSTGASRAAIHALFGDCCTLLKVAGLPDPGEEAKSYMN